MSKYKNSHQRIIEGVCISFNLRFCMVRWVMKKMLLKHSSVYVGKKSDKLELIDKQLDELFVKPNQ